MRRALGATALVLALALVAATAAIGQRRAREAEVSPLPSVQNAGPAGLSAARAFLLASRRVTTRHSDPGDAPPPGSVVLLAAPGVVLRDREVDALLAHARAGGTVVFQAGRARQPALARRLAARLAPARGTRTAAPLAPHPLVAGLELPVGSGFVESSLEGALPIAGGEGPPSALSVPVGEGEVILLSGPEPLSNARIAEGGALSFLVRLASRGPVAFDERWLLPRDVPPPPSRLALAMLLFQMLLAGAVLVLSRARRLGAVRPPPREGPARTSRDYLASLASLYRRAGAEREIAAASWRRARRALERRTGVPAGLPASAVRERLARRSPAAAAALVRGEEALHSEEPLFGVGCAAAELERILGTRVNAL